MIHTLKLKKSEYSDLESLLARAGLVENTDNPHAPRQAHPERLYVNLKTYRQIESAIYKAAKKERPYLLKNRLISIVGRHMLNIGPNICDGVKDGYCVVLPHKKGSKNKC